MSVTQITAVDVLQIYTYAYTAATHSDFTILPLWSLVSDN